jgi:hypothetical protein
MGTSERRSFAGRLAVLGIVLAIGIVAFAWAETALAGKPPPSGPPSDATVYFQVGGDARWWTMATDGSGKAVWGTKPQRATGRWSDAEYGGYVWCLNWAYAASGTHPDGETLTELHVSPVTPGGAATKVLSDPSYKPFGAAFRPGSSLRLTFDGVHWYQDAAGVDRIECGLFEIALTPGEDGTISAIGSPTTLFAVEDDYWTQSTGHIYGYTEVHDWISSTRVAHGRTTADWRAAQIVVRDIPEEYPAGGDSWSLIPAGSPLMGGAPHYLKASPDGTKVAYRAAAGVYEIATSGSGTPSLFVAQSSGQLVGDFLYEDGNTLVFTWQAFVKKTSSWTYDVYRQVRGASKVNLTGDTSSVCSFINVR